MEKRKISVIITVIGVMVIIIAAVFIKFDKNVEEKEENYLKENIVVATKKCVKEEKCPKNTITISNLIDNEYISEELNGKLEDYSKDSYITYPEYVVTLIKND